jgi:hypothetical protein
VAWLWSGLTAEPHHCMNSCAVELTKRAVQSSQRHLFQESAEPNNVEIECEPKLFEFQILPNFGQKTPASRGVKGLRRTVPTEGEAS